MSRSCTCLILGLLMAIPAAANPGTFPAKPLRFAESITGLKAGEPVEVIELPAEELVPRCRAVVPRLGPKVRMAGLAEVLATLEMIPPTWDPAEFPFLFYPDLLAGCYDPGTGHYYLQRTGPGAPEHRWVGHAITLLLAKNGLLGFGEETPGADPEQWLTRSALRQGLHVVARQAWEHAGDDWSSHLLRVEARNAADIAVHRIRFTRRGGLLPDSIEALLAWPPLHGTLWLAPRIRADWKGGIADTLQKPATHTLSLLMGDPPSIEPVPLTPPAGWSPVYETTLGAALIETYLTPYLDEGRARTVVLGWRGDRTAVWRSDKHRCYVHLSRWEDEQAATYFLAGLERSAKRRLSGAELRTNKERTLVYLNQGDRQLVARRHGNHVVWIEGLKWKTAQPLVVQLLNAAD